MNPSLLIVAAGVGMIAYEFWRSQQPVGQRLQVGDVARVKTENVILAGVSLPPGAVAFIEVKQLEKDTFAGTFRGLVGEWRPWQPPASLTPNVSVASFRNAVLSADRMNADNEIRPV